MLFNMQYYCIHELGHTLGLWHEHQSPWRGDFMQLNWNNISPGELTLQSDTLTKSFNNNANNSNETMRNTFTNKPRTAMM